MVSVPIVTWTMFFVQGCKEQGFHLNPRKSISETTVGFSVVECTRSSVRGLYIKHYMISMMFKVSALHSEMHSPPTPLCAAPEAPGGGGAEGVERLRAGGEMGVVWRWGGGQGDERWCAAAAEGEMKRWLGQQPSCTAPIHPGGTESSPCLPLALRRRPPRPPPAVLRGDAGPGFAHPSIC